MIKRILFSFLLFQVAHAKDLTDYSQVLNSLKQGERLTLFLDWDTCEITNPNGGGTQANFMTSVTPDDFFISKKGYILIHGATAPSPVDWLPGRGLITQNYSYLLKKSGALHVTTRFLNPTTNNELADPIDARCQLGNGFKIFSYQ